MVGGTPSANRRCRCDAHDQASMHPLLLVDGQPGKSDFEQVHLARRFGASNSVKTVFGKFGSECGSVPERMTFGLATT